MDWAPKADPFSQTPLLAIAIGNQVYMQDILQKNSKFHTIESIRNITALKYDPTGEAIVIGNDDSCVVIYDVEG